MLINECYTSVYSENLKHAIIFRDTLVQELIRFFTQFRHIGALQPVVKV